MPKYIVRSCKRCKYYDPTDDPEDGAGECGLCRRYHIDRFQEKEEED
jgi:hypothetical protein